MIFRYPGGKSRPYVQQQILRLLPDDISEYREGFLGGGGIFWGISPSVKRWINDLDPNLMAVYFALRDRPDEFTRLCRMIPPHSAADDHHGEGRLRVNLRLKSELERLYHDDNADPALRYLFVNRLNWLGRVIYGQPSRVRLAHARGWDVVFSPDMGHAAQILKGTRITCEDYARLLSEPGEQVFIFLDPPYYRPRPMATSQRLYTHEFEEAADHEWLAEEVRKSPHRWMVCYNDCAAVRALYRNYNFIENKWAYVGQHGNSKKIGRELVITNYDLTSEKTKRRSKPRPPETTERDTMIQRMVALGRATSERKANAARENGRRGGRPPGTPQSAEARAKISAARQATSSSRSSTHDSL